MSENRPFHFRHFSMMHHEATMKIGTDAILLGAFVQTPLSGYVLDVGTGSGILCMMIAQRCPDCIIGGIDIDQASVNQANFNFNTSQWRKRLSASIADIRLFNSKNIKYHLILSNPPFFTSAFKTQHERRNLARHTDTLTHAELIEVAVGILHEDGIFAVVIPFDSLKSFQDICFENHLYLSRQINIIPVEDRQANRVILEFCFSKKNKPEVQSLTIRNMDGSFTPAYNQLLKNFYLGLD